MKHRIAIGVVALAAATLGALSSHADAALDSLVANERAFAAHAAAHGMKSAFLAYLAEEAVVFQPTATDGRKAWETRPDPKASLLWEPAYAQVSSAGDLGYTTGPWELRPPADSTGAAAPPESILHGQFNSIWRKFKGGVWRVVLDIGVSHARPTRGGVGSGEFVPGLILPRRTMKSARVKLAALDERLSKAMRTSGVGGGLAANAADDLRLNTEARFPARGVDAAQARADSLVGFLQFQVEGSDLASSSDLGYTYGTAVRFPAADAAPADTSVYVHVWRQDANTWKLALAIWSRLGPR